MDGRLRRVARDAIGFMPESEGLALYRAALADGGAHLLLEIGSYCGKSAVYLGAAAAANHTVLFSLDHHRGSEEHQPGERFFDRQVFDDASGRVDSLPRFRATIAAAGLEDHVVAIVGASEAVARRWATPLGLLFIDGGHSDEAVRADYEGFAPCLVGGGTLAIHDVFEDPAQGGRPPFEVYSRALASGAFEEAGRTGSLRVLTRVASGI